MSEVFLARQSDWPHPACLPQEQLMKQVQRTQGRTSGPGGQHRNKVATQIVLQHEPTGLIGQAGERRSPRENESVAIFRLRLALATSYRIGVPMGEIGSRLWHSRLQQPKRQAPGAAPARWGHFAARIVVNPAHWDYPALLAEAMDVLAAMGWEPKEAALRLEASTSQLIKLIREHPPAFTLLNEERVAQGLHLLR